MSVPIEPSCSDGAESAECTIDVPHPMMVQRWDQLTFLHWDYEPEIVQQLLPPGLTVDTFDGRAWVGLVPFMMQVRGPVGPAIPWISNFCETNVRTYARAEDGTRGVWFLSLDAARFPAVATARTAYRLPYYWSKMSLHRSADTISYSCERRWPGSGVSSDVSVRIGDPIAPADVTEREMFLSARWRLYSPRGAIYPATSGPLKGLRSALAEHAPWPLHRAEVIALDDDLVRAGGLPAPESEPLAHWSPGVEVRIGLPSRVVG